LQLELILLMCSIKIQNWFLKQVLHCVNQILNDKKNPDETIRIFLYKFGQVISNSHRHNG
jgi:hypothetical protein